MLGGDMMQIRAVNANDIPRWQALSAEYDRYVRESVADLTEWYDGNDSSPAFFTYMQAKISQGEVFMAADADDSCLGIIAFSKKNNRITFFAVSHRSDFQIVGNALFECAFEHLSDSKAVFINEIISSSEWMQLHGKLYRDWGFCFHCDAVENGVPVKTFMRPPS